MKYKIVVTLLSLCVAGCATLIPERHNANLLMGHDISEAYQYFGRPYFTWTDMSNGRHGGEKVFVFIKSRGSYTTDRLVGSDFGYDGGAPTVTEYYQRENHEIMCRTSLWVNDDNVIDYYEIQGDCGVGGLGLGSTGAFHKYGIN